ncbi:potassium transporter-domain-containing protein [Xylariales sp. PMI_506]|nr:potassium transporter-domain-containing protein [Xylariales sp. PMI_506]
MAAPESPDDEVEVIHDNHTSTKLDITSPQYETGDGDFNNEEKARRIAQEDLNRSNKQNYRGTLLFWAAWQSTGVIYGDIGTSPLYVFSSTFSSQPSWDDLVGALSIIIWSLTLIVTVKYCFIVLLADDDGQGGTFALYSLLARYANIISPDPNTSTMIRMSRPITNDLRQSGRGFRDFIEQSKTAKNILKLIGVLGVSMVMSDGMLTPAQSVLGAIQGIKVVNPDLGTNAIVGISVAILICLFLIQPFGTSKIGSCFAPIVIIWLLFNLCAGIYNLAVYDYTVLKAFSPYFAFTYLIRNGSDGWKSLGGLLLAFTGVEALFADIGAFGKTAIQLSWLCLAFPCLLLAYVGQAAYISYDETQTAFTNPFFYTVPPGTFYFSMVIAVLAAVVASQAMITSAFQLLSQVMRLSYFPHIKTVHTSTKFHEQVYMPLANWLLMVGTVIITAVYNNTTSLGNAYGVCVIMTTFLTTCMVSIIAIIVWKIPSVVVLILFLIFGALDGVYLSSVLLKVPDGAWFSLMLAVVVGTVFILWRWGKEQQWAAEAQDRVTPSQLFTMPEGNARGLQLSADFGGGHVTTASGLGIFFDKVGGGDHIIPKVFTQFVRRFHSRPEVVVFFHLRALSLPTVPTGERFVITRAQNISSCYFVTLRHGYMDDVMSPDLGNIIVDQLSDFVARFEKRSTLGEDHSDIIRHQLDILGRAGSSEVIYAMGKQSMRGRRSEGNILSRMARNICLEIFLWLRENTRAKLADLAINPDSTVEIGWLKHI